METAHNEIASVVKSGSELRSADGGLLIAGSKHVHNVALREGVDVINPEDVISESAKDGIAGQVAEIVENLARYFSEVDLSEAAIEALLGFAIKLSFREIAFDTVCTSLDHQRNLQTLDFAKSETPANRSKTSASVMMKFGQFLENQMLGNRSFFLDFSSQSAKKLSDRSEILPLRILLPKSGQSALGIQMQNAVQHFKQLRSGQRVRLTIPHTGSQEQAPCNWENVASLLGKSATPSTANSIVARLVNAYAEFDMAKRALGGFLKNCKQLPEYASFNNLGSMELSGFAAAAHETQLPVHFTSHGAMIAHGDAQRKLITGVLSRAIFNEPACATHLLTRSKLQVAREPNVRKLKPRVRVSPFVEAPEPNNRPFRVYLAPNFLSWYGNYHGITHSCFEAEYCIRKLAQAVAPSHDLVMDLRLKTSTNDVARKKLKEPDRGLLPSDVADLIDEKNGIFDASYGSHSAFMEKADLVVTEGVTAVTFEALEMRKPLLFVNKTATRAPALPATRIISGQDMPRSATYCCGADDNLKEVLQRLRRDHLGKPLTNAELSGLVWV